ncbi:MAG: pesticin C-terminus-like muramidase [Pseudomonadota bacterium]
MIHRKQIDAFLTKWERRELVGYVPCNPRNFTGLNGDAGDIFKPIGASGVTIATGLDLGQQSERELVKYGLPASLVTKFKPYIGLKKADAVEALATLPLCISDAECDEVNACVHSAYIARAQNLYERQSVAKFDDLPCEAQVVVVSLVYSLGSPKKFFPKAWGGLCTQDWYTAGNELCDANGFASARRHDEGVMLLAIED